jgi:hypothetical protein
MEYSSHLLKGWNSTSWNAIQPSEKFGVRAHFRSMSTTQDSTGENARLIAAVIRGERRGGERPAESRCQKDFAKKRGLTPKFDGQKKRFFTD